MTSLIVAMVGFVGGHFLLSLPPVRAQMVSAMGEKAFLAVYSVISLVFLAWAVAAYRGAPLVFLYDLGPFGRRLPLVIMPAALMLAVAGLTTRGATAVGGERALARGSGARGIFTITRHPFLWGTGLWALAHLAANGDGSSLVLFGGMAVLSFGGMLAIDHKRAVSSGESWRAYRDGTSLLPFAAALQGRTRIDWRGIGWLRVAAAVALYFGIAHGHGWLFGAQAM